MIIMVAGSKGGIGKSLVSLTTIDLLGLKDTCLIETDTSNPDVYKALKGKVKKSIPINLDSKDDWLLMIDFIETNEKDNIVINTRSAANMGIKKFGDLLTEACKVLQKKITVLWVMNSDLDGGVLLREFIDSFEHNEFVQTHVVLNEHFGDTSKFVIMGTETEKLVKDMGGQFINFPDLADRVRTLIYNERKSIDEIVDKGTLGTRIEAKRWREIAHKNLSQVLIND